MRTYVIYSFICCLAIACKAQMPKPSIYTDMAISGKDIWLLTTNGTVQRRDAESGTIQDSIQYNAPIITFAVGKQQQLIAADSSGRILSLDPHASSFKTINHLHESVYNIVINLDDRAFAISQKGITDLSTHKTFKPDTAFKNNRQLRGWGKPSTVFVDANNNLWLGYSFGEWGGEIYAFNTDREEFVKITIKPLVLELNPVRSFFSDGKDVFMSCGLQHMETSGAIFRFSNFKCDTIFLSEHDKDRDTTATANGQKKTEHMILGGEYIGPALYNPGNHSIYFYSQDGVFKGDVSKDLSKFANWKKVFKPSLHWRWGQPDAVGSPMNVLKMQLADNGKLYLLTQNDGLGVYADGKFTLLE